MYAKKFIIIGCPGSGKSTFARQLHQITSLPLYHLDMLYWNADRTTVTREIFDARLGEVMDRDAWIIDGNFNRTMELRIQKCDAVIFLDYPREVCIEGIRSRVGKVREDIPWVEHELDKDFLKFVNAFETESRPNILDLLEKYSEKQVIIFHSRDEGDQYLQNLAKK